MELSFAGKRVLVTGAGQGIGRELAKKLAKCGAKVTAMSKTEKYLKTLKEESPMVKIVTADVTSPDIRKTLREHGPFDCLVNNAALAILEPVLETTEENFDTLFNVNTKAVFVVSQEVARMMVENKIKGSIVNLSSQASKCALRDHLAYCASKSAVDMLSKVMALELGEHGIRVNCVNPTVVMTAMGKIGWADPAKANPLLQRIPLHRFAEFRVPNLFSSTASLEKLAEKVNPPSSAEKQIIATPKERISRAKEVRSVSQHFYLADMNASESSTSSSSDGSQEGDTSEIELAKRKVNKFLDYDLIPIQPPENRQPVKNNFPASLGRKTPLKRIPNKPAAVTPLSSQLTQLRKGVSEIVKKIPIKADVTKQKTVKAVQWNVESKPETWGQPLSPVTRAAVTSEFKKLKKASELKLRNKLKKTVTNITLS